MSNKAFSHAFTFAKTVTSITQENKLGQRFIGASDFLKNGILSSILAMFVIVTVGYAIMRTLG